MANVVAVCISEAKGIPKHEVAEICLREHHGILGDAHSGDWHRQVSLLGIESVDKLRPQYPDLSAGAFAENVLTKGVLLYRLSVGTQLQIGDVLLEITQIGKECHAHCAIRQKTGDCVMPREGVFAVVLKGGVIRPGSDIAILTNA
ncbi:MAG: MOSC domain-containing protein [Clostridia bacterium]|nr:MOSC domain-containing protein [Clostridia bacterium]